MKVTTIVAITKVVYQSFYSLFSSFAVRSPKSNLRELCLFRLMRVETEMTRNDSSKNLTVKFTSQSD